MKHLNTLLVFIAVPFVTHTAQKQVSPAQKEEIVHAEQAEQVTPAFNLNFTVATSNAQDARAQNSTTSSATQAQIQQAPPQQPQIIIVKQESESVTKSVLLTLYSAGVNLGVVLLTNGKGSAPIASKPVFVRVPMGNNANMSPHIAKILQALKK